MKKTLLILTICLLASCQYEAPKSSPLQERLNHTQITFDYENEVLVIKERYQDGRPENTWEVKAKKVLR